MLNISQRYKINFGAIFDILDMFTDSMIVKASDDYIYAGNMLFITDEQQAYPMHYDDYSQGVRLYTVITPLDEVQYEYSLNNAEFKELEYPEYGSALLNLDKDANTVVIRRKENKKIDGKALIIKDGNGGYIILLRKFNRWDEGANIYTLNYGYQMGYKELYEYSMDGGNTFYNIYDLWTNYYFEEFSNNENAADLFDKRIIIRRRDTGEVVYKTPELDIIDEKYTYENGKTTINFKQEGFEESDFSYEYIINGETKNESNLELDEDTENIIIHISGEKEFTTINLQKQIDVKVIQVDKPTINVQDNKLEIVQGEIINDELGNIFYSVDGGEYLKYTEKVNLDPGTHTIKAYVVSKDKEIKGDEIEKDITIEKQEEKSEDNKTEENTNIANEIKEEQSQIENTENTKNSNKSDNSQTTPKTSDNIIKTIGILSVIAIINILVIKIRKNK